MKLLIICIMTVVSAGLPLFAELPYDIALGQDEIVLNSGKTEKLSEVADSVKRIAISKGMKEKDLPDGLSWVTIDSGKPYGVRIEIIGDVSRQTASIIAIGAFEILKDTNVKELTVLFYKNRTKTVSGRHTTYVSVGHLYTFSMVSHAEEQRNAPKDAASSSSESPRK